MNQLNQALAVRVTFMNDEGERATQVGYGITTDDAIADALARLCGPRDEYNRRGWTMEEWEAA